jgi:hypothetical protein
MLKRLHNPRKDRTIASAIRQYFAEFP